MAILKYSKQDEYDLANSGQDCLGWTVTDQAGNQLGAVTEMLIDTGRERIDSIIVNRRLRVPAADFALRDGHVIVRGVYEGGESNMNAAPDTSGGENEAYAPVPPRTAEARHIAGLTREARENEIRVPVVEEELRVGKRTVRSGGARIQAHTQEVPVSEPVTLRDEKVTVERRPADRLVENAPGAFKEGTIEVTETSEVPVVDKQIRVTEEIVVGKEVTEREEIVRDTVKRRDVEVEKYSGDETRRPGR